MSKQLPKDWKKQVTPFQAKVYAATLKIPKGQVRTYGQIAKAIGNPKAARAVGRALGANPFAPTVPCHRVIASDGQMRGYTAPGGIKAKRKMLKAEGALP